MTDRYESRATTHADDCWSWGPGHYDCAVREIERLRSILIDLKDWDCDGIHPEQAALAALREQEPVPSIPAGYKLVPAWPTPEWVQSAAKGILITMIEHVINDVLAAAFASLSWVAPYSGHANSRTLT